MEVLLISFLGSLAAIGMASLIALCAVQFFGGGK